MCKTACSSQTPECTSRRGQSEACLAPALVPEMNMQETVHRCCKSAKQKLHMTIFSGKLVQLKSLLSDWLAGTLQLEELPPWGVKIAFGK